MLPSHPDVSSSLTGQERVRKSSVPSSDVSPSSLDTTPTLCSDAPDHPLRRLADHVPTPKELYSHRCALLEVRRHSHGHTHLARSRGKHEHEKKEKKNENEDGGTSPIGIHRMEAPRLTSSERLTPQAAVVAGQQQGDTAVSRRKASAVGRWAEERNALSSDSRRSLPVHSAAVEAPAARHGVSCDSRPANGAGHSPIPPVDPKRKRKRGPHSSPPFPTAALQSTSSSSFTESEQEVEGGRHGPPTPTEDTTTPEGWRRNKRRGSDPHHSGGMALPNEGNDEEEEKKKAPHRPRVHPPRFSSTRAEKVDEWGVKYRPSRDASSPPVRSSSSTAVKRRRGRGGAQEGLERHDVPSPPTSAARRKKAVRSMSHVRRVEEENRHLKEEVVVWKNRWKEVWTRALPYVPAWPPYGESVLGGEAIVPPVGASLTYGLHRGRPAFPLDRRTFFSVGKHSAERRGVTDTAEGCPKRTTTAKTKKKKKTMTPQRVSPTSLERRMARMRDGSVPCTGVESGVCAGGRTTVEDTKNVWLSGRWATPSLLETWYRVSLDGPPPSSSFPSSLHSHTRPVEDVLSQQAGKVHTNQKKKKKKKRHTSSGSSKRRASRAVTLLKPIQSAEDGEGLLRVRNRQHDYWIPEEVFHLGQTFRDASCPTVPLADVYAFLCQLNRVWRQRLESKVAVATRQREKVHRQQLATMVAGEKRRAERRAQLAAVRYTEACRQWREKVYEMEARMRSLASTPAVRTSSLASSSCSSFRASSPSQRPFASSSLGRHHRLDTSFTAGHSSSYDKTHTAVMEAMTKKKKTTNARQTRHDHTKWHREEEEEKKGLSARWSERERRRHPGGGGVVQWHRKQKKKGNRSAGHRAREDTDTTFVAEDLSSIVSRQGRGLRLDGHHGVPSPEDIHSDEPMSHARLRAPPQKSHRRASDVFSSLSSLSSSRPSSAPWRRERGRSHALPSTYPPLEEEEDGGSHPRRRRDTRNGRARRETHRHSAVDAAERWRGTSHSRSSSSFSSRESRPRAEDTSHRSRNAVRHPPEVRRRTPEVERGEVLHSSWLSHSSVRPRENEKSTPTNAYHHRTRYSPSKEKQRRRPRRSFSSSASQGKRWRDSASGKSGSSSSSSSREGSMAAWRPWQSSRVPSQEKDKGVATKPMGSEAKKKSVPVVAPSSRSPRDRHCRMELGDRSDIAPKPSSSQRAAEDTRNPSEGVWTSVSSSSSPPPPPITAASSNALGMHPSLERLLCVVQHSCEQVQAWSAHMEHTTSAASRDLVRFLIPLRQLVVEKSDDHHSREEDRKNMKEVTPFSTRKELDASLDGVEKKEAVSNDAAVLHSAVSFSSSSLPSLSLSSTACRSVLLNVIDSVLDFSDEVLSNIQKTSNEIHALTNTAMIEADLSLKVP